jgi:TonB family protein
MEEGRQVEREKRTDASPSVQDPSCRAKSTGVNLIGPFTTMRKRRHQRGGSVLFLSFACSIVFNILAGFPLKKLVETYLSGTGMSRPVRVVSISAEQWSRNMRTSTPPGKVPPMVARRADKPEDRPPALAEKKPEEKKQPKKDNDKLNGQIVEVPPTQDDSPNPEAKFLARQNSHVTKESIARPEDRNSKLKHVTNKLQTTEQPNAPEKAIVTPGLSLKGDGLEQDREGTRNGSGKEEKKQKFVLEIPDLQRRDQVHLKLGEGPGIGQRVANRSASDPMKGNSDSFNLQLGSGSEEKGSEAGGGKKGPNDGKDDKKPLPTLAALMPTFGMQGKISGSPSRDWVEGMQEGDGTFLNTKEFKYATFFYRVRDSVASFWEDLAASEYRRRDPTGNIYGIRDRSTLLRIQLNREGGLADIRVEQTSGVDFLDHVAVEAFRKAEPFPNPPPGIQDEDGNIRFNFQFVVTMRPRSPLNMFQFR